MFQGKMVRQCDRKVIVQKKKGKRGNNKTTKIKLSGSGENMAVCQNTGLTHHIASSGRKRKTLRYKGEKKSVWTQGQIGHENNIFT